MSLLVTLAKDPRYRLYTLPHDIINMLVPLCFKPAVCDHHWTDPDVLCSTTNLNTDHHLYFNTQTHELIHRGPRGAVVDVVKVRDVVDFTENSAAWDPAYRRYYVMAGNNRMLSYSNHRTAELAVIGSRIIYHPASLGFFTHDTQGNFYFHGAVPSAQPSRRYVVKGDHSVVGTSDDGLLVKCGDKLITLLAENRGRHRTLSTPAPYEHLYMYHSHTALTVTDDYPVVKLVNAPWFNLTLARTWVPLVMKNGAVVIVDRHNKCQYAL